MPKEYSTACLNAMGELADALTDQDLAYAILLLTQKHRRRTEARLETSKPENHTSKDVYDKRNEVRLETSMPTKNPTSKDVYDKRNDVLFEEGFEAFTHYKQGSRGGKDPAAHFSKPRYAARVVDGSWQCTESPDDAMVGKLFNTLGIFCSAVRGISDPWYHFFFRAGDGQTRRISELRR